MLDFDMPSFNGLQVLATLQAAPELSRIPVIMMSGRATKDLTEKAMSAGAKAVIPKPFDLTSLQTTLAQYLPPAA
jgi:CheY-like chemotaxis protein